MKFIVDKVPELFEKIVLKEDFIIHKNKTYVLTSEGEELFEITVTHKPPEDEEEKVYRPIVVVSK